jgi:hypothetical protein
LIAAPTNAEAENTRLRNSSSGSIGGRRAPLDGQEHREGDAAEREGEQRDGRIPAPGHLSGRVEASAAPRPVRGHVARGEQQRDSADGDVEYEHRPPAHRYDQQPAEDRARGRCDPRHRRPHADRAGALRSIGIGRPQHRQRARHEQRHADALGDPGPDEEPDRGGGGTRRRRDREQAQAGEEDAPAPEPVAQRAPGEQQRREHQRVGVDHPLQPGDAALQLAPEVGQRNVDGRRVEDDHEIAEADPDQRQVLAHAIQSSPERFGQDRSVPGYGVGCAR